MAISLSSIFDPGAILLNLENVSKETLFAELTDAIAAVHPDCEQSTMLAAIWEREKKMSTGIAAGIAIPHAVCNGIHTVAGAIGISKSGIDYGALDDKPVHIVFMLAMGDEAREYHLRILDQISMLTQTDALSEMKSAKTPQDVHAILAKFG
jgi:mannitol/fructose-specific phosphotransferase system IIA component (Ntr-type)